MPLEQALAGCCRSSTPSARSRFPQLSSIELIFKRGTDLLHARQLVQERVDGGHADAADLGEPAGDDPAAVVDQPGHEDRAVVGQPVPDRDVDDRLLEDPGPAAARARRGQRRRSGASGCRCCRSRSTRHELQANTVSLDEVMDATADALDAGLLRFSDGVGHRHRRVRRHAQPAAATSGTCMPIATPDGPRPRCRSAKQDGRQLLLLDDVADVGRGPPAADRRRGHQRRPGPDAHRREAPLGQHAAR